MAATVNQRTRERRGCCRTVKSLPVSLPCGRNESQRRKKGQSELLVLTGLLMSGRLDSNQRPPEPHSGALAKLRHAPNFCPSWTSAYCYHAATETVKVADMGCTWFIAVASQRSGRALASICHSTSMHGADG